MAKFKLLAGQFIEADKSKPIIGKDSKPTGRFESRTYKVGGVVESAADLTAKHGAGKFEPLGGTFAADADRIADLERQLAEAKAQAAKGRTPGTPPPENLAENPAVFPGGQVSTGFQGQGGALAPKDFERAGANVEGGVGTEEDDAVGAPERNLEGMTLHDLREYAEAEEIDLRGARSKDDVIKAIRAAR